MWSVNSGAGNAASPLLTWQRHKSAHRKWLFINYRILNPTTTTTTTCFLGSKACPTCRGLAGSLGALWGPGPVRGGPGAARALRGRGAGWQQIFSFSWDGRRRIPRRVPLPSLSPSPSALSRAVSAVFPGEGVLTQAMRGRAARRGLSWVVTAGDIKWLLSVVLF